MGDDLGYLLAFLGLLILSAGFSASETAYFSLSQLRLKKREDEGDADAGRILAVLADKQRLLMSILLGNTLVNVAATTLATVLILRWVEQAAWVGSLPFGSPRQVGVALASLVMTLLILTFGEVFPKTVAIHHAERLAVWLLLPLRFLLAIFAPVTWAMAGLLRLLFSDRADWNQKLGSTISMEEIDTYFSLGEETGAIESDEKEMISSVFEFGDTTVREVMKPRIDIRALPLTADRAQVLAMIREDGHSRVPVYQDNIDKIEGVLYVKDLFLRYDEMAAEFNLKKLIRPAYFVPETKKLDDLLREFQRRKIHLAIVVDEFGGTSGLVTLEDLLEEIVGEIADEFDNDEATMVRLDENTLLVDSRVSLRDVENELDIEFESVNSDSVSGLVMELLGRIPKPNEQVDTPQATLIVHEIKGHRILRVKIIPRPKIQSSHDLSEA